VYIVIASCAYSIVNEILNDAPFARTVPATGSTALTLAVVVVRLGSVVLFPPVQAPVNTASTQRPRTTNRFIVFSPGGRLRIPPQPFRMVSRPNSFLKTAAHLQPCVIDTSSCTIPLDPTLTRQYKDAFRS